MEKSLSGQLKIEFTARSAEFSEIDPTHVVKRLTELHLRGEAIDSGDESFLIFFPYTNEGKQESVERIAYQVSYREYIKGAAANVVDSPKNRSGTDGDLSIEEFKEMKRSGEIDRKLRAARSNANNRVRGIIADNYRKTDVKRLSNLHSDKQAMPARLRQADKTGGTEYAPFDFTRDVLRPERAQDRELLLEFAKLLDKQDSSQSEGLESYKYVLEAAINGAKEEDNSLNPDASRFVYELAKLWVVNASEQHKIWQAALSRYNGEFPDKTIDPYDPKYFVK